MALYQRVLISNQIIVTLNRLKIFLVPCSGDAIRVSAFDCINFVGDSIDLLSEASCSLRQAIQFTFKCRQPLLFLIDPASQSCSR